MSDPRPMMNSLKLFADLIGEDLAIQLAQAYGGLTISIPSPARLRPESPVAIAVGVDAARVLAAELGPGMYYIAIDPSYHRDRALRDERIYEAYIQRGERAFEIGRREGVSSRRVRAIASRMHRERSPGAR